MQEFLNITPETHADAIRQTPGKLYILYFNTDCVFCRMAVLDLIRMPENALFTYAVCQLDGQNDFRLRENIVSVPTVRVYENGNILQEARGYNRALGAYGEMRGSIEKCPDYRLVYADHAATEPMSKKALKAYCDCAKHFYGNPSAAYEAGLQAKACLTRARSVLSEALHLKKGRIVFTSGGSEANALALHSARCEGLRLHKKHIITSAVEHPAVLRTLEKYAEDGFTLTVLPVDGKGLIDPAVLEKALRPDTVLVSVMFANNETGTIQPVKKIGRLCRAHGVLFHSDAVQAVGHIPIDLSKLNIDYLSLAAHKFGGPKGAGALAVSENAPLFPLLSGGGQESGFRAGTENVQAAAAMATALQERVRRLKSDGARLRAVTERIRLGLTDMPGVFFNGDPESRLPGTVNFSFSNVGGRELLFLLDAKYGISASGGSACHTGSPNPSHVLTAMGLTPEPAGSAVRISLDRENTAEDADYILRALRESVEYLRSLS